MPNTCKMWAKATQGPQDEEKNRSEQCPLSTECFQLSKKTPAGLNLQNLGQPTGWSQEDLGSNPGISTF